MQIRTIATWLFMLFALALVPAAADFPTPHPLGHASPDTTKKGDPVQIASFNASTPVYLRHFQSHLYDTSGYCWGVIDVGGSPGSRATLTVIGTPDRFANNRYLQSYESPAIHFAAADAVQKTMTYVIPFRHTTTMVRVEKTSSGGELYATLTPVPCAIPMLPQPAN